MEALPPTDVSRADAAAELSAALGGLVAARGAASPAASKSPAKMFAGAAGGKGAAALPDKENSVNGGATTPTQSGAGILKASRRAALGELSGCKTDSPVRKKPRKSLNRRVSFAPVLTETRVFLLEDDKEESPRDAPAGEGPHAVHVPAQAPAPAHVDDAEVVAASPEASPAQAPAPAAPEPEQAEEEVTPEGSLSPGEAALAAAANFDAEDFRSPTLQPMEVDTEEVPDSASPVAPQAEQQATDFIQQHLGEAPVVDSTVDLAEQLDAAGEPTSTAALPSLSALADADEAEEVGAAAPETLAAWRAASDAAAAPLSADVAQSPVDADVPEPTCTINLPNMSQLVDDDEKQEEAPAEPTSTMDLPNMSQLVEADEQCAATPSVSASVGQPRGVIGGGFNALLGLAQTPATTAATAPSPAATPADATSASPAPSDATVGATMELTLAPGALAAAPTPSPAPAVAAAGPSPMAPPSAQSTGSAAMEMTLAPGDMVGGISPASLLPGRVSMGSALGDSPAGDAGEVTLGITAMLEQALEGGEHPRWGAAQDGSEQNSPADTDNGTGLMEELPAMAAPSPAAAPVAPSPAGTDYGTGLTEELPAMAAPSPAAAPVAPSPAAAPVAPSPVAAPVAPSPAGMDYGTGLTEELPAGTVVAAADYGTGLTEEVGAYSQHDYGTGLTEEIAPGALAEAGLEAARPSNTYHTGATATLGGGVEVHELGQVRPSATYHTGATATLHATGGAGMEAANPDTDYHTGATGNLNDEMPAEMSMDATTPAEIADMGELVAEEEAEPFDAQAFLDEHGVAFRTDNMENARRKSAFPAPALLESPEPAPTSAQGCLSLLALAGPELRAKEAAVAELTRANASRRAAAQRHAAALAEMPPHALLALGPDSAREELRALKRRCRVSADSSWAQLRGALEVSRAKALDAEAEKLEEEKGRLSNELLALRELAGLVRSAAASTAEEAATARATAADVATSQATAAEGRAALSVRRAEVRGFAAQRRDAAARVEALRLHLAASSEEAQLLRKRRAAAQARAVNAGRTLSTAPTPGTKNRLHAQAAEVAEQLDVLQGLHSWSLAPGRAEAGAPEAASALAVEVHGLLHYDLSDGAVRLADPTAKHAAFVAALAGAPAGADPAAPWQDVRSAPAAVQALDLAAARAHTAIRAATRAAMHPVVVRAAPVVGASGGAVVVIEALRSRCVEVEITASSNIDEACNELAGDA